MVSRPVMETSRPAGLIWYADFIDSFINLFSCT
jgi:hypothetical protein